MDCMVCLFCSLGHISSASLFLPPLSPTSALRANAPPSLAECGCRFDSRYSPSWVARTQATYIHHHLPLPALEGQMAGLHASPLERLHRTLSHMPSDVRLQRVRLHAPAVPASKQPLLPCAL